MRASSRPDPPIAALFILLFVALVLALVALVRSANVSPTNYWTEAMTNDDYAEAALALTDQDDLEEWLVRTESLALRHGEIEGFQHSGGILLPPGEDVISVVKLHWDDGYTRCLFLREGEDGSLSLMGGYFDCSTFAERIPEDGQLIPESRPPNNPGGPGGPEPSGPPLAPPDLPPVPAAPPVR